MTKRWLIRTLLLLPILLCLIGWYWSANHKGFITYSRTGRFVEYGTTRGAVSVAFGSSSGLPEGWSRHHLLRPHNFWPADLPDFHYLPWFTYSPFDDLAGHGYVVFISYSLLLVLCGAAFFVAWRKTRPNPISQPPSQS